MTTMTPAKPIPAIKERPILFNGEMVKAILEGQRTQTRRVIKSPAKNMQMAGCEVIRRNPDNDPWYKEKVWSMRNRNGVWGDYTQERFLQFCPYGKIGDRLWVRETWGEFFDYELPPGRPHGPDGHMGIPALKSRSVIIYRSDGELEDHPEYGKALWKPSIHMPRWASRINLEITDIRVERLQEIAIADIEAEGVTVDLFESMLEPIAKKLKVEEPHWICHHEMDECGTFCFKCGEKRRKELLKTASEDQKHNLEFLDGGWAMEEDSPPRCETCGMSLDYCPTDHCFEEEMYHFAENGCYPNPLDAFEMLALTGTTNSHNEKDTHAFLKIAWRFLWDSINAKRGLGWEVNPWVWALTFKVV